MHREDVPQQELDDFVHGVDFRLLNEQFLVPLVVEPVQIVALSVYHVEGDGEEEQGHHVRDLGPHHVIKGLAVL